MIRRTWSQICVTALVFVLSTALLAPSALAQRGWDDPVKLSEPVAGVVDLRSAVDALGNVTVVWVQSAATSGHVVMAARYTAATDVWSPPVILGPGAPGADVAAAATPDGGALAIWTTSGGVHAAWYSALTGQWGADTIVAIRSDAVAPVAGVDGLGNAIVVWERREPCEYAEIEFSRYTIATGLWTDPDLSASRISLGSRPDLAVDAQGNAVAVWLFDAGYAVGASQYSAASGMWSAGRFLTASVKAGGSPVRVAMDAAGNAFAIWRLATNLNWGVYVNRYSAADDEWGGGATLDPSRIPTGGGLALAPSVAVTPSGDAIAVWTNNDIWGVGFYSRYAASTDTWSGPHVFAQYGRASFGYNPEVEADPLGNAFVVGRSLHRYSVVNDTWTTQEVSAANQRVVVDSTGEATVVGTSAPDATGLVTVYAMRWVATPDAPTVGPVTAETGGLSIAFTAPPTSDAAFAPTNYEYSLDDGATWTTRAPASASSPLEIGGLTGGVEYQLRLRAVNAAGPGQASATAAATPGPAPGPPTDLTAVSLAGHVVTIRWMPPQGSVEPTGYVLEGGVHPGEILASISTGSTVPTFTFVAPTGAFFIRVHAITGPLRSLASNEIPIVVNVPAAPSAPQNLKGLAAGSAVALSWTNTFAGGTPTGLWLEVTGALATTLALPVGETFYFPNVPDGVYTFRVFAASAAGISPPSNPVTLTFPSSCAVVPDPPSDFLAWRTGSSLFVSWSPPAGGPAVTQYRVSVSGSAVGTFHTTARALSASAAPGSYVIAVQAANLCGWGAFTMSQTVTVP
jgi:hypothetical protein